MVWKQAVGFTIASHIVYICIHHIHYHLCIGGLSPWSFLYGVNAYSNFMCTEVQSWNVHLGESLKGLLVGALAHVFNEARSLLNEGGAESSQESVK